MAFENLNSYSSLNLVNRKLLRAASSFKYASLLPRWRGAAPIERAILAGDEESGVTIMQMDAGLDTGPMLLKAPVTIHPDDNREILLEKLTQAGKDALLRALDDFTAMQKAAEEAFSNAFILH